MSTLTFVIRSTRRLPSLLALLTFLLGLVVSADAAAHNRRFCFKLQNYDDHDNDVSCPLGGLTPTPGNLRGCTPQAYKDSIGTVFQLWDRDTGAADEGNEDQNYSDDYIGTYVHGGYAGGGWTCVTFNWEATTASLQEPEALPDLYIKAAPIVKARNGVGPQVLLVDDYDHAYFWVDFRASTYPNCTPAADCNVNTPLYTTTPSYFPWQREARDILDDAQHTLEVFGSVMGTGTITIKYQDLGCLFASDGVTVLATGTTLNRNKICMNPGAYANPVTAPHELGHVLQERLFGQDYLRDVILPPDTSHSITTSCGSQSCATAEGWADYVAVRSWWDPENVSSDPRYNFFRVEQGAGDYMQSTPCSSNVTFEAQVMKGFWDLDDANNEPARLPATYADLVDLDTIAMAQVWANFVSQGTADRQAYEAGNHGVNLWDYYMNGPQYNDRGLTLLHHNCLQSQELN